MVREFITVGQKLPSSNPNLGMDFCSGSDFTLNGVTGLFNPYAEKMTINARNRKTN